MRQPASAAERADQDRGARRFAHRRASASGRAAFPAQLERALKAKGLAVEIANAGVSGDTAAGGLARLDWSVPEGTDAVILELGANDMLRGIDPKVTRDALDEIVRRLKERRIEVLLCGMLAPPNLGPDYARGVRLDLSGSRRGAWLCSIRSFSTASPATPAHTRRRPASDRRRRGEIVAGILPKVEELIARVRAKPQSDTVAEASDRAHCEAARS